MIPLKSDYRGMMIVFLFLGILAGSFAGNTEPLAIHEECTNGLDDDNSQSSFFDFGPSGIDVEDIDCFYYPMSDGNGEDPTEPGERFTSIREYPSLFRYHDQYYGPDAVCAGYAQGLYIEQNQMGEADQYLDATLGPQIRAFAGCQ